MSFRRPGKEYVEGAGIHPSNLPKNRVEEYARLVANTLHFDVRNPLGNLVECLGGTIHYEPADEWFAEDGSIYVHGEMDFDIVLPSFTSPLRDRFTTAHELGHYFLHSRQGNTPLIAFRSGSNRIEWEANWFAAELLMPKDAFRAAIDEGKSIPELAVEFFVSEDAAKVRHESLTGTPT